MHRPRLIFQIFLQIEESSALGNQRHFGFDGFSDFRKHLPVFAEFSRIQFRITPAEIEAGDIVR